MNKSRNNRKKRKNAASGKEIRRESIPRMLLRDLLLTVGILVVFSLFHHVIPHLNREPAPTPVPIQTPLPTPGPAREETPAPALVPSPTPSPEPEPDPMDWKTKFASHFTADVVETDHSYQSPGISIDIQKYVSQDEGKR